MTDNMKYIVNTVTGMINSKFGDELPTIEDIHKEAETIRAVACVAIVFVLAFSVISRYMRINELEKQILTIEADVGNIKNANDQKEVMLENTMTLEEIENEARVRLGMNKPANNQIVYVSIQNQDVAHVVQN